MLPNLSSCFEFRHFALRIFVILWASTTLSFEAAAQLSLSVAHSNITCFGANDGSATSTATGGNGVYAFAWSNGQTTASISGLAQGSYTVTVTSGNETESASINILQPSAISVLAYGESQICGIAPDGQATAVPNGGVPPYQYNWSNGATSITAAGLSAGVHTVTVTDINGCTATSSAYVYFWDEGIWLMMMGNPVSCIGEDNGSAVVSTMSGTAPYTYLWDTGQTTKEITNLAPGTYTVTVTDDNGCTNEMSYVVEEAISFSISINAQASSCTSLGSATATIVGGVGPFVYEWSNGSNTSTANNLPPGEHSVTVYDANGCPKTKVFTISGIGAGLTVNATVLQNAQCATLGSATVQVSGGTGNYNYDWSSIGGNSATVSLPEGTYQVTVTDAVTNCIGIDEVTIDGEGATHNVDINLISGANCNGGGSAQASTSGGTSPYTYAWDNGQSTSTATNLSPGSHTVSVTDANGCVKTASINMTSTPAPMVMLFLNGPATCGILGSATASVSGGEEPYTYEWSDGQTTKVAIQLEAGDYTVTITDANGCTSEGDINIPFDNTLTPNISVQVLSPSTCNNGGSAQANVTGGSSPYTYAWDNGQTTSIATNLSAGTHSVTVTDANQCTQIISNVAIPQQAPPVASTSSVTNISCLNTSGSATIAATGGLSPFTYLWSNGNNGATANNLTIGAYTVTVVDAVGCTSTTSFNIIQAPNLTANTQVIVPATCTNGGGTALATPSGGVAPYSYLWNNGQTTAQATNLTGLSSVTITDAAGCQVVKSIVIPLQSEFTVIGDRVFNDLNQDGSQGSGEVGATGFTIMLMQAGPDGSFGTSDDVTVTTVTTNSMGQFVIPCVQPGTYILMFTGLPNGYQFTRKDFGNDCSDSDVNPNGKTDPFTILPGQADNFCFDAGIHPNCDNLTNPGTICCNQTICEGDAPSAILEATAPSGGAGALEYMWMELYQPAASGAQPYWITAANSGNTPNYQPGTLTQTMNYMRCIRRVGCVNWLETNVITINVLPAGDNACGGFTSDFSAKKSGNHVQLVWTARNDNASYEYHIQHSRDNFEWHEATMVKGLTNTNGNPYTYMHTNAVAGANYYRIMRKNDVGVTTFSEVLMVMLDLLPEDAILISPNPVTQSYLYIENQLVMDKDMYISMFSVDGTFIRSIKIPQNTTQTHEIDLSYLSNGIYFLTYTYKDGTAKTVKIAKFN